MYHAERDQRLTVRLLRARVRDRFKYRYYLLITNYHSVEPASIRRVADGRFKSLRPGLCPTRSLE